MAWVFGPPMEIKVPGSVIPSGGRNLLPMFFSQKQVLRFRESDGLQRSPEIGPRRSALSKVTQHVILRSRGTKDLLVWSEDKQMLRCTQHDG